MMMAVVRKVRTSIAMNLKDVSQMNNEEKNASISDHNQLTGVQLFSMTTSMVMTVYGFAAFAKQGFYGSFPLLGPLEKWLQLMAGVKAGSLLGDVIC